MSAHATHSQSGIDPRILKEAAQWLTRFQNNEIDDGARREWQRWKSSSIQHDQAWEKAERLLGMLRTVPSELAAPLDRPSRLNRRQAIKAVIATALVGPAGWLGYRGVQQWLGHAYSTGVGETLMVKLSDGISLTLNTDTTISLDQSEGQRQISLLGGELLLDTMASASASANATTLATDDGWLRIERARVNLRRHRAHSVAAVMAGAVQLTAARSSASLTLLAHQQASFTAQKIERSAFTDADTASAWVDGVLYAEHMRLGDFIDELGRYRQGYIVCDPAVAELRISGAFQLADTGRVLATLQQTLPVQISFRTPYWVSVTARRESPART